MPSLEGLHDILCNNCCASKYSLCCTDCSPVPSILRDYNGIPGVCSTNTEHFYSCQCVWLWHWLCLKICGVAVSLGEGKYWLAKGSRGLFLHEIIWTLEIVPRNQRALAGAARPTRSWSFIPVQLSLLITGTKVTHPHHFRYPYQHDCDF